MTRLKRIAIYAGAALLLSLALIGLLTVTRGTPVRMVIAEGASGLPAVTDPLFARVFELYTGTRIDNGNSVQQMLNGNGTYPQLWRDMRSARQTLTVQMYYSLPGAVADTMAAVLSERARAGVRVLLLLDAFGSQNLPGALVETMKRSGVEIAYLRQLRWYTIHNATERSHVRVVVVDGRIGYTGGFGLADYWLGNGHAPDQWRESNVRFEGPAVMQLQAAFGTAWAEATGELITGDRFFPRESFLPDKGTMKAGLLYTAPTTGSTPAERFLALSIASARKRLYITNSYFVPDADFRRLLRRAAQRGVDVRVLTVNGNTDVKSTWYAGRYRYEELLSGGVKIYEYQPAMLHSKAIVVDDAWGTIGSMNFDNRSLSFNNESNLVVLDSLFGAQMDSTFFDDLRYAKEMTLTEFRKRGVVERLLELGATLVSRLL